MRGDDLLAIFTDSVIVHPGEILVLRVARNTSYQVAHEAREYVIAKFPQLADRVLVVSCDQLGVVQPTDPI